jgi:hypothetical protein
MNSVFLEARNLARLCHDTQKKARLIERTDKCKETFDRFAISAARSDMECLVADWSRMLIAIAACSPAPGPGTVGGREPLPEAVDAEKVYERLTGTGR